MLVFHLVDTRLVQISKTISIGIRRGQVFEIANEFSEIETVMKSKRNKERTMQVSVNIVARQPT